MTMAEIAAISRLSASPEFEEEVLDPRVQVELEKLNRASEEINSLELDLDDARSSFRQTLSDSSQKLNALSKKLGNCIEKARPYYDARMRGREAQFDTQKAALRFERACNMHEAAKEMVQLAEQGYMKKGEQFDPAWQEMLNHATMKVNEAEKERIESEENHMKTARVYNDADQIVQRLQKDLKRAIAKSSLRTRKSLLQINNLEVEHRLELLAYFDTKAKFNQLMEEQKKSVSQFEGNVTTSKAKYSSALRNLEAISDDIHRQRLERCRQKELGVRVAGVGADSPPPPPHRDRQRKISDGSERLSQSFLDGTLNDGRHRKDSGSGCSDNNVMIIETPHPNLYRNPSFMQAIESSMVSKSPSVSESFFPVDFDINYDVPSLEDEYMSFPSTYPTHGKGLSNMISVTSQSQTMERRSGGLNQSDSVPSASREPDILGDSSGADPEGQRYVASKAINIMPGQKRVDLVETTHVPSSPSTNRKTSKLQGIVLKIDPRMCPMIVTPVPLVERTQAVYSPHGYKDFLNKSSEQEPSLSSNNNNNNSNLAEIHAELPLVAKTNHLEVQADTKNHVMPECSEKQPLSSLSENKVKTFMKCRTLSSDSVSPAGTPVKSRRTDLLGMSDMEESSDTESIASTGPMMDDEMVEMLTLQFPDHVSLEEVDEDTKSDVVFQNADSKDNDDIDNSDSSDVLGECRGRPSLRRTLSLPPHLSHYERYIHRPVSLAISEVEPKDGEKTEASSRESFA